MNNAGSIPCDILLNPKDEIYAEGIRKFQGCPTVATTKGGRIFLAWYAGGTKEPHMENYNVLHKSDDGVNFGEPILIIPSSKENLVHALDIQLWTSPDGALYVFWTQNNVVPSTDGIRPTDIPDSCPWVSVEGYDFNDFSHNMWVTVCENPDADELVFSPPRRLDSGFLRTKPLVLADGRWVLFNYDQTDGRYGYSVSCDGGKTFVRKYGATKLPTLFDEAMAFQGRDLSVTMFARAHGGRIAKSVSYDGLASFTDAQYTDLLHSDSRFYVGRTPSGRIMLVHNNVEKGRCNLTVSLSDDDGKSFGYSRTVDARVNSYPDVDFIDSRIYLTYDRERLGAREILLLDFTEEDLFDENHVFTPRIISKPQIN